MKRSTVCFFCAMIFLTGPTFAAAQSLDAKGEALSEFRWGVRAFHNGLYEKSLLSFEKALSLYPALTGAGEWLGHVYWKLGYEENALSVWQDMADKNEADALLLDRKQIVERLRGPYFESKPDDVWAVSGRIDAKIDKQTVFYRPSSLVVLENGGFVVTSYADNRICKFDINGVWQSTFSGGIVGYDRPFDIIWSPEGNYWVSEYKANRILKVSKDGFVVSSFGKAGSSGTAFYGPQYLAQDGGSLFISDWGNRRIVKTDLAGTFLLEIKTGVSGFAGFTAPLGLAAKEGRLFAVDGTKKCLFEFDTNGNFIRSHLEGRLSSPEGLSFMKDGRLLIADGNTVYAYEPDEEILIPLIKTSEASRLMKAVEDKNGQIYAADYQANAVFVFSPKMSLYSGLFIDIERIASDDFPSNFVQVRVLDFEGRPVTGLSASNFILTENKKRTGAMTFFGEGQAQEKPRTVLLAGLSGNDASYKNALADALGTTYDILSKTQSLASVGFLDTPSVFSDFNAPKLKTTDSLVKAIIKGDEQFDLGLKLASDKVLPGAGLKNVIYFADSKQDEVFSLFSVNDLSRYMKNNSIRFWVITLDPGAVSEELQYLVKDTGGAIYYYMAPQSLYPMQTEMNSAACGTYILSYRSYLKDDYGQTALPLEVEVHWFQRSGRDEKTYFTLAQ